MILPKLHIKECLNLPLSQKKLKKLKTVYENLNPVKLKKALVRLQDRLIQMVRIENAGKG
ncbi:MAG: hypothetical protein GXO71_05120 [Caldiserica bacterium]|nr:hypothetical protein [Caldisericota bacterium]